MTDTAVLRSLQTMDILFRAFQKSVWLNLMNRNWEDQFRQAYEVKLNKLTANVSVMDVDRTGNAVDGTDLTGPAVYTSAELTDIAFHASYVRASAQIDKMDVVEGAPQGQLPEQVSEELSTKLAIHLDNKFYSLFTAAAGTDAVTKIAKGSAGSDFIAKTQDSGYKPSSDAAYELIPDILDEALLTLTRRNFLDGEIIGEGHSSQVAVVWPPEIGLNMARYLKKQGLLTSPSDIAGQAEVNKGIVSNTAFMGRYNGMDLVSWNGIKVPTGNGKWNIEIVSTMGCAAGAVSEPDIEEAGYGDGSTQGAYVQRWTAVSRWGGVIYEPDAYIRGTILSA